MRNKVIPVLCLLPLLVLNCGVGEDSAPAANGQSLSVQEDAFLPITLTCSLPGNAPYSWELMTFPSHGALAGTPPQVTYTPDPDYNGPDSFTFRVNDGYNDSNAATVTITVTPVNDPPTLTLASIETDEDSASAPVTPQVLDADPVDSYSYSILTQPLNGTASAVSGGLVYLPHADYNGGDFFTFRTRDSGGQYVDGTATVTIHPVNDPPASTFAVLTTEEDTVSSGVTPSVTDIDGEDSFTFAILTQPVHGTASIQSSRLYYQPAPDYNGSDSFTYRAFDSGNASVDGTARVVVVPVNDPPVASNQSVTAEEDVEKPIVLAAGDIDGDDLTFALVTGPVHGTLSGNPPAVTYLPGTDYYGDDSFSFLARDGSEESNVATVSITVNPVNDPPSGTSASITTYENTPSAGVTPTVTDVDAGESFAFTILTQPTSGTARLQANQLSYEPQPGFSGTDSFTYRAFDSASAHVDGTATVTILAVNDPPVADTQAVTADEDAQTPILLTASDVDGDTLSYAIVEGPAYGTLSGTPPAVTYLSAQDYNGPDSFTFLASDGSLDSNPALVTITVQPVNDPPTETGAALETSEDTTSSPVTPWVVDADILDSYSFSILTQPAKGTASLNGVGLVYDPAPDTNGADSFTFRATDAGGLSVDGEATVNVIPVNDPPTATSVTISTDEDTASTGFTPTVLDIDSADSFTFTILTQPLSGTATIGANQLYYDPVPDFNGSDTFTYRAFDSGGESVDGTALVNILAVNDPPVADTQSVTALEDVGTPILLTGSDIDGDELTYSIVDAPANGALSGTPPNVVYLSRADYHGPDSFSFSVSDGSAASAPATVSLDVQSTPDTWFVDIDAAGTADGHSWDNAFIHPQDALDIAGNGDEVWVTTGVYAARNSADAYVITMVEGVDLYGGFTGVEISLEERDLAAGRPVLDGEDLVDGVLGAGSARLDGFAVTRSRTNGMRNVGVSPTVVHCLFEDNGLVEGLEGGAIHNEGNANAVVSSTTFINNQPGAIYNGDSSPTIRNCDFYGNSSDSGGAIRNVGIGAQPTISNSLFDGNAATGNGGAISNEGAQPLVEYCVFARNTGLSGGALSNTGAADPVILNSLFMENTAAGLGGAVYSFESTGTIINCTLAHNQAGNTGGVANDKGHGGGPNIINSILWYNSTPQIYNGPSSKTTVTYSDVQGGYPGTGNIDQDPAFVDTSSGNYALGTGSPCIDAGSNAAVTVPVDLAGNPRIADGDGNASAVVDMGAFEFIP